MEAAVIGLEGATTKREAQLDKFFKMISDVEALICSESEVGSISKLLGQATKLRQEYIAIEKELEQVNTLRHEAQLEIENRLQTVSARLHQVTAVREM